MPLSMTAPFRSPFARRGLPLACTLALIAGSLAGCGEDKAQDALDQASRQLTSINAGSNGRQWSTDKVYQSVVSSLKSLPGSASEAQQAAASLMVAQAERGLAELDARDASLLMGDAMLLIGPAEAELRAITSHAARAAEAQAFDPSAQFARLKQRAGEAQSQAASIGSKIEAHNTEASTLREQVASLRLKADEYRLQAADLQAQADSQTAVAGVSAAERAHAARREADTLALQALAVEQQAMTEDQQAAELAILQQKFVEQLAALKQAEQGLEQRATRMKAEAAEASAAATEASQTFQASLSGEGGLDQHHATLIPEPFDKAISQYQGSVRSAQAARSVNRGSASLAIGLANQALANLHTSRGEGLVGYAALLQAAGDAGVPGASEYASRASQARERAGEHATMAAEAYEAAIGGYEGSGAKGNAAEVRDSLAARLKELQSLVLDQQAAPESFAPAETPDNEGDSGEPAAAAGDDAGAVRQAIANYQSAVATADGVAGVGFLHPAGPAEEKLLATLSTMATNTAVLDSATEAKFGEKFSLWAQANPQAMGPLGAVNNGDQMQGPLGQADVDALDIRVSGDEAVAILDDGTSVDLVRAGGQWKQVFRLADLGLPPGAEQGFAMMDRMAGPMGQLMRSLASRVESGELASNQAVAAEMVGEMMAAMRDMMGGANGTGGGG